MIGLGFPLFYSKFFIANTWMVTRKGAATIVDLANYGFINLLFACWAFYISEKRKMF